MKLGENCNQISVEDCLTECPELACSVRDLRLAVQETDIEDVVELALEEHWHTAYDEGVTNTLKELKE